MLFSESTGSIIAHRAVCGKPQSPHALILRLLGPSALGPLAHVRFRCAVERDLAPPHAKLAALFLELLTDLQFKIDVELAARLDLLLHIFGVDDVIHRRPHARPEKLVVHLLADHDVIAAAFREEIHARSHLGIAKQRCPSHRVVPVAVDALERQHRAESCGIQPLHADPRAKRIRQPDERTHLVPEVIPCAQPADERFKTLKECQARLNAQLPAIAIGGSEGGLCFCARHACHV